MIVELLGNSTIINDLYDALNLIGNATQQTSERIIIHKNQLHPDFFLLRTGLAGEILQKFSTYRLRLAIVGNFDTITSKSMKDFIIESNRHKRICFTGTIENAIQLMVQ